MLLIPVKRNILSHVGFQKNPDLLLKSGKKNNDYFTHTMLVIIQRNKITSVGEDMGKLETLITLLM